MSYRAAYAVKGFDALRNDPARWFVSELAVYFTAAVAAGLAFLIGSALYAYLWAAPQLEIMPAATEEPRSMPPLESPSSPLQRPPGSVESDPITGRTVPTFSVRSDAGVTNANPNAEFVMIDNRGILHLPNSDLSYDFRIPVRE